MNRIVTISDLHGWLPPMKAIPACDILLIGGDLVPDDFSGTGFWTHDAQEAWLLGTFAKWLEAVPAKHVVGIAGNHDIILQGNQMGYELPWTYLNDESTFINGLTIHGSPMSPEFGGWAFMKPDSALGEHWDKIPENVDILMVHGPMYGMHDLTEEKWGAKHVGSQSLRNRFEYGDFPNLKAVVTGHIHPAYGKTEYKDVLFLGSSYVDPNYKPTNLPHWFVV